jgi:hypothetical protein
MHNKKITLPEHYAAGPYECMTILGGKVYRPGWKIQHNDKTETKTTA